MSLLSFKILHVNHFKVDNFKVLKMQNSSVTLKLKLIKSYLKFNDNPPN